jgi:hypothetical protein
VRSPAATARLPSSASGTFARSPVSTINRLSRSARRAALSRNSGDKPSEVVQVGLAVRSLTEKVPSVGVGEWGQLPGLRGGGQPPAPRRDALLRARQAHSGVRRASGSPVRTEVQGSTLSGPVHEIRKSGDGARGIVLGQKGKDAHVFNVVNVKGDVIFPDGQSGHAKPTAWRRLSLLRTD